MAEQSPARPKTVVVVDAENPLVEIQGEFFWREDHDQIVAAVRQDAYQDGYEAGWRDGAQQTAAQQVVLRYRPPLLTRLSRWAWGLIIVTGMVTLLVVATVGAVTSGR
ncbi:MAG: hypothetical protein ACRDPG_11910 [Nocardioidaceae bacterium]